MHCTDKQSQLDLNLDRILEWSTEYVLQPSAKKKLLQLTPSNKFSEISDALQKVNEWRKLRISGDPIPALEFEELQQEIKLLGIQDSIISREGFWRILLASQTMNSFLSFIEKRKDRTPMLQQVMGKVYYTLDIIKQLNEVFDKDGSVKDNASDELLKIRNRIKQLRAQINRNFEKEMRKLVRDKLLGETYETFVNNRRVLLVQSAYKRKVTGNLHGTSKTGNLSYIEPLQNVALNNELDHLIDDENKEILRILKKLTRFIASFKPLITAYNQALISLDFIQAKARLALEMKASLPIINKLPRMNLIEAFHPILWKTNLHQGKVTVPQQITLNEKQKIVVISGPNAGGKSITLKTVGLLQMMLQCGFLIPVNEQSEMCYFQQILSDIGDNQSIDNELSTYSYRLKRMKYFLEASNARTLLLLDEFGSGSDPELGGVLAEVFLEELYERKSFAVITTHYSTIKSKAEQLKNVVNGCMLFDISTLLPLYKLAIGQPGSSFTFEVASQNGFDHEIIKRAKLKLDPRKIKMDALLHDIQKERNYLERLIKEHETAQRDALQSRLYFDEKSEKLNAKLASQNARVDLFNKEIQAGKKMLSFVERFALNTRKKSVNDELFSEIKTYLTFEKSRKTINARSAKKTNSSDQSLVSSKEARKKNDFQQEKIKCGSLVQLISSNRNGTVESINGEKVTVIFGNARMKVSLENLKYLQETNSH